MLLDPLDMLRRLGSGVRPGGSGDSGRAEAAGGVGFSGLLASARRGVLRSGRGVGFGAAGELDLSEEEASFIGAAADAAESLGARRLVVPVRGWLLGVDLLSREIDEVGEAGDGVLVSDAEAVALGGPGSVVVGGDGGDGGEGGSDAVGDRRVWSGWSGARRVVPVARGGSVSGLVGSSVDGTAYAVLGEGLGNASLTVALARVLGGAERRGVGGEGD